MILHLKRFEFDQELMRTVKVNDFVEFPNEIDMKPFTKEGLEAAEGEQAEAGEIRPDDYYNYELKGVLIHSGTSESGHYYSIAKDRGEEGDDSWYMFNDESVMPFDKSKIPEQCYGGVKSTPRWNQKTMQMENYTSDKPYSAYGSERRERSERREGAAASSSRRGGCGPRASPDAPPSHSTLRSLRSCRYLLIYERKHVEFVNDAAPGEKVDASTLMEVDGKLVPWHPPFGADALGKLKSASKVVDEGIFKDIWENNKRFLCDKNL